MDNWLRREPESFAQGDTLCWRRTFRDYPSGAGWGLTYSLAGGVEPIKFFSTPDADGVSHDITVPNPVTALWLPGQYLLLGDAILPAQNGNPPQQHQFYEAPCNCTPNAAALPGNVDLRTNAEKALATAWCTFNQLNASFLDDSKNGETDFYRRRITEAWRIVKELMEVVYNEKNRLNARAGKPARNKVRIRANIMPQYPTGARFGAGWPYPYGGGGGLG